MLFADCELLGALSRLRRHPVCWDDPGVTSAAPSYKRHRYPVEIIDHGVWLYFRFTLSFREVEEMMLARGVVVSYETIRRWWAKFGPV